MIRSLLRHDRLDRFAARPEAWVILSVIVVVACWRRTGILLPAAALLLVYVLWRLVREIIRLRRAVDAAQRERAAIEGALHQSQRLGAVGRLTTGIAHDFNNHLTAISSNIELVRRRLDTGQERAVRHLDAALHGVQRAATLTSRLLSFTHESAAEPEIADIARLLAGLSDLLRRMLDESVDLDVRLPEDNWFVWVDVNQMENALLSLAVNAREQIRDGGVLTLAVSNVQLNQAFVAAHSGVLPGDYVRIVFSDATIVEQGESALECQLADESADARLTDAGLSMARGLIRQAGGCLLCSGSAGQTPSLRLFLPRYLPPASSAVAGCEQGACPPAILVVEDDSAVRRACVETLRELHYTVLEAPDAMEAFRLIADTAGIHLLFTDIGLPGGVSGRALADAARTVNPGIKVLFTTGYPSSLGRGPGETAVLPKPFNPVQLAEKVRQVLNVPAATGTTEIIQG